MKKLFGNTAAFFMIAAVSASMVSCENNFLDVRPDMGLTEEEVFSYYDNTWAFFNDVYNTYIHTWPLHNSYTGTKINLDTWSPCAVGGREQNNGPRRGYMKLTFPEEQFKGSIPILSSMLKQINQCNVLLENVDRVTDATEEEILDMKGQAYFMRALGHFCLARFYGGWPYQDHVLKADEDWDLARLPLKETYQRCAADMYTAYEYFSKIGKMRRDSYPGMDGHLRINNEFIKPSGTAALAFRGRMLLYAASPLANPEQDPECWKEAAEAAGLALKVALEQKYALQPMDKWRDNFVEVDATNENIWQYRWQHSDVDNACTWLIYAQNNKTTTSGTCPTQNYVDKFETVWGEALNTEEDRAAATAAGHYNETGDPYNNRDPRLNMTIVHDGTVTKYGIVCNMYKDKKGEWPQTSITSSTKRAMTYEWGTQLDNGNGFSRTGYAAQKYWRGNATNNSYPHLDAFRLAEVYLNYAEATNEYGGPDARVGESPVTAREAVNAVRARMEMPEVASKYTGSKEAFRPRIRNERQVEFAYEGNHYWFDSRRWVDVAKDDANTPLYGIYVTEVDKDAQHPNGRNYERRVLPDVYQSVYGWQDYMFFIPIPSADALKMKNFINNEFWPVQ